MGTFLLFAVPFSLVGWLIYIMLRYTRESIGEDSPLKRVVVYQYGEWDFLKWANTPILVLLSFMVIWICWLLFTNSDTAAKPWHYILIGSAFLFCAGLFYIVYKVSQLEKRFWAIIDDTALELDPATKSITVFRAGTSTSLTADTVALIESHVVERSSKSPYYFYRFIDYDDNVTYFFDYGKGLRFAIEEYFKGVPMTWVEHKFPFNTVLAS
ncbi:hypothetical protein [Fibrella aquatica]|uniref:hypothetical protein n=1 Tax=Fibrella aquatica TaxID=3242487 RepID=UPI0035224E0B